MKYLLAFLAFSVASSAQSGISSWPQGVGSSIPIVTSDPTGSACSSSQLTIYTTGTTGTLFQCVSGVFAAVSGGGPGSVTHTAGALTSNAIVVGNGAADIAVSAASVDSFGLHSPNGVDTGAATGNGTLPLSGSLSGTVTQTVNADAGTWTYTWPFAAPSGAHQFHTVSTLGIGSFAQPSFSDLSGSWTAAQAPAVSAGDVTNSAGSTTKTVVGLNGAPFCTGFAPTNLQYVRYTTASSPNPCYTAATVSGGSAAQYYSAIDWLGIVSGATDYFVISGGTNGAIQSGESIVASLVPAACDITNFSLALISSEAGGGNALTIVSTLRYGTTPTLSDTAATCTLTTSSGGAITAGSTCSWSGSVAVAAGGFWDLKVTNNTSATTPKFTHSVVCQ